jgi:hypothetical protein
MTPWRFPSEGPRSAKATAARTRHLHVAVQALIAACDARSIRLVKRVLHANATLLVDGGSGIPAPRRATRGAASVAAALVNTISMYPDVILTEHQVNALPGIVMRADGRVVGVISVMLRCRAISAIWIVLNPDKLTHWNVR